MNPRLRAGIGACEDGDGFVAGRTAAATAVAALGGEPPALVIVYSSACYDLDAVLGGVRDLTGDTPLVGATSAGTFHLGRVIPDDRGVSVLAVTAGPYRFAVASTDLHTYPDIRAAGSALAREVKAAAGPDLREHAALLLLSESFAGDQQALLAGVHRVVGAGVPVVGGSPGDDRSWSRTRVFHDDRVLAHSAVAVWIDADEPFTVSWGHGWQPMGSPLMATKVDGLMVEEINGRPAMDVYLREVGYDEGPLTPGLYPAKVLQEHPVGLLQPDGSHVVRVWTVEEEDRLSCFSPIPLYAPIQVLTATPDDMLGASESVVGAALHGREPGVLLGFSCSVRVDALGERIHDEAARMQAAAGDVPTFGFYTYGEFARSSSVAGYHNASLVALAL